MLAYWKFGKKWDWKPTNSKRFPHTYNYVYLKEQTLTKKSITSPTALFSRSLSASLLFKRERILIKSRKGSCIHDSWLSIRVFPRRLYINTHLVSIEREREKERLQKEQREKVIHELHVFAIRAAIARRMSGPLDASAASINACSSHVKLAAALYSCDECELGGWGFRYFLSFSVQRFMKDCVFYFPCGRE